MKADKKNLFETVNFLAGLEPTRSFCNILSLDKAADYIKSRLNTLKNLKVTEQTYEVQGATIRNIRALYNSGKAKRLIVGAHYDSDSDSETPGADDNASAVAGLLEIARMLNDEKPALDYEVELVAFSLEEPPFFGYPEMGSFVHAKSLKDRNVNVIGMICLEMIGYFNDLPVNNSVKEFKKLGLKIPEKNNFIIVLGIPEQEQFTYKVSQLMKNSSEIEVVPVILDKRNILSNLSDHINYWEFNFNAVMVNDTSNFRNPNYHQITDTIETLNFDKMTEVVNGVYNAVKNI